MNDTVHNLIKENRKLFYNGQLRNKFKSEIIESESSTQAQEIYTFSAQDEKKKSLTTRSIEILQALFID